MNHVPMSDGLVWARVVRPNVPIVYLDLNHFIFMARANTGDPTAPAGYKELLDEATLAVREERVVLPLSSEHVFEIGGIKDPKQRKDVADVMETLSGFHYLLGRPDIARLEIEAGIEAILEEVPELLPTSLLGTSFGWAFGMVGGVKIVDEHGNDVSAAARQRMGAKEFSEFIRSANHTIERGMLDGPPDDEIPILREKYGYAPELARDGHKSRLDIELDLSQRLASMPKWRRGRLRDLVSAREISHEWLDAINRAREDRVRSGRKLFKPSDDQMRRFMAAMPHTQVAISMKTRYHRNPAHIWTTNDITDIDAMSVAYSYCDAVFTDKEARAALADSKELRTFKTFLPRTPGELTDWLTEKPKLPASGLLVPYPPRPPTGLTALG